ncbi:hypothetical protein NPIL_663121 [Nephila pilipes]|uniref:Uncharacterized protein n=1 Tax=Nephila pilipes TaxID=299642 RepID=A0A8X6Q8K7_NEPPI|nr:hypothetical protein NPIL_663121 [Nephila pilipes]
MLKIHSRYINLCITSTQGDESWIYAYRPETKQQSTVWVFQDEQNQQSCSRKKHIEQMIPVSSATVKSSENSKKQKNRQIILLITVRRSPIRSSNKGISDGDRLMDVTVYAPCWPNELLLFHSKISAGQRFSNRRKRSFKRVWLPRSDWKGWLKIGSGPCKSQSDHRGMFERN